MDRLHTYKTNVLHLIKKEDYLFLWLLIINGMSFGYIIGFGGYFFRDFSVIFDGGLRIWYGQVPYRDFFIPTGPMVYYIQGLFAWIFGPNTLSMKMHSAFLSAIVLTLFFIYARKYINNYQAFGLTIFLHFFYYARLTNPWYDQTALFFYFVSQFIILYNIDKKIQWYKLSIVGFLTGLCVFSKQDVGGLAFIFIFGQLFFFSNEKIKYSSIYILSFFSFIILTVSYYDSISDFGYWFNYGQSPHNSRLDNILSTIFQQNGNYNIKILGDFRYHTILFSIIYLIILKDFGKVTLFNFFFLFGSTIFSIIFESTSGQGKYSSLFFMPIIALFVIKLLTESKHIKFTSFLKSLIGLLIVWILFSYFFRHAYGNTFVFWQAIKKNQYGTLSNSCFEGTRFKHEIIDGIESIKSELQKNKNNFNEYFFLNMSSYTFLYKDLNIEPPRSMHLYYHKNVSLFDKDYTEFKKKLKENPFQYILLQEMASGTPPLEFREYLHSIGYDPILVVDTPKSGVDGTGRGQKYNATLYKLNDH